MNNRLRVIVSGIALGILTKRAFLGHTREQHEEGSANGSDSMSCSL